MSHKREIHTFFCMVAIFVAVAVPASGMSRKPPEPVYVDGQVIVKFHENVSRERISQIVEAENAAIRSVLGRSGLHLVILPEGLEVSEAVNRFNAYPEVRYAEPNFKAQPLEGR